jgi:hypothetical protein
MMLMLLPPGVNESDLVAGTGLPSPALHSAQDRLLVQQVISKLSVKKPKVHPKLFFVAGTGLEPVTFGL